MSAPRWVSRQALLLLHDESLAEHGGAPGLRDEGLLESALARPPNLMAYGEEPDLAIALSDVVVIAVVKDRPELTAVDGGKVHRFRRPDSPEKAEDDDPLDN